MLVLLPSAILELHRRRVACQEAASADHISTFPNTKLVIQDTTTGIV